MKKEDFFTRTEVFTLETHVIGYDRARLNISLDKIEQIRATKGIAKSVVALAAGLEATDESYYLNFELASEISTHVFSQISEIANVLGVSVNELKK